MNSNGKVFLVNSETGERLELGGLQEISLAEETIERMCYEKIKEFDQEFVCQIQNTDPMAALQLKLMLTGWAGKVPRIRINKARWPWRI